MNKDTKDFLNYYINSDLDYSIMINGEWGSGKTFFINKYIEEKENIKFIKISLFGLTSLSEIDEQIFEQLHPILSSKPIKLGANILKGALKLGLKVDLDGDDKSDGTVNIDLSKFNIDNMKKDYNSIVFIFDDFERSKLDHNEILSYISKLLEDKSIKVIILSDEKQINEDEEYNKYKEKVIGKTFKINSLYYQAFNSFINSMSDDIQDILIKNKKIIKEIFQLANYNNLRDIKYLIKDLDFFYLKLDSKFKVNQELLSELIYIFFALGIELKKDSININKFINFHNIDKLSDEEFDQYSKETTKIDKLFKKYSLDRHNLLFEHKIWIDILVNSKIDSQAITKSLLNSKYYINETKESWIKLYHFVELEGDEFENSLQNVENKFYTNQYSQHEVLLHVVGILLFLSENGLCDKNINDIKKQAEQNIDNLVNIWKKKYIENGITIDITDIEDNVAFSLQFYSYDMKEFKEIKKYLLLKNKEAVELAIQDEIVPKILQSLKDNDLLFINEIFDIENHKYNLQNISIFDKVKIKDFFDNFINLSHQNIKKLSYVLEKRYRFNSNNLQDELIFWRQFRICLKKYLKEDIDKLHKYHLNNFLKFYLEEKIINRLKK